MEFCITHTISPKNNIMKATATIHITRLLPTKVDFLLFILLLLCSKPAHYYSASGSQLLQSLPLPLRSCQACILHFLSRSSANPFKTCLCCLRKLIIPQQAQQGV